jgi:DNA mismatch repair protein MutS2
MPANLTQTSDAALGFPSLLRIVRGYCQSETGAAAIEALRPTGDRVWIERQHRLTTEVRAFLRTGGGFGFDGITDISRPLSKARIPGAMIEAEEIRAILTVVERAASWREVALHPPVELRTGWPLVGEISSGILDFRSLLDYFEGKLMPDGSLDDSASPALRSLRREIERQRQHIHASLGNTLRRLSEGGAVRDELITMRGERFVIPVKVEQKRKVAGVIHGASGSGQTVFIEPLETIEQNNELVRLMEEEQAEVVRILREMSSRIGQNAAAIGTAAAILTELEMQFAKARYAEDYSCVAATILAEDGADSILLREARHPVLEANLRAKQRSAVPLTLEMTREQRQLIISGPNTGGKTVGLKTVGLIALAAQAGIPVPATEAKLPLFDAVHADIGDAQSIEENLSTFSAHVANIHRISLAATSCSLVLLDELGSATDPEEGAALAVSIAKFFLNAGALTLISTHHTALKVYATGEAGVVNAAVGFDEHTLAPTYELRVGVPGASAGINIAQKLGLNPLIIREARKRIGSQTEDIGHFLDSLHAQLREIESERATLRLHEKELDAERRRLEAEGLREQKEKLRAMELKLESLLRDFEYHARESVNAIQDRAERQKLSKDAERRIAKARREFREQFNNTVVAHTTGADKGDDNATPHIVAHVSEGDTVQLKSLGRAVKVLRKLEGNQLEVQAGPMKMRVPLDDVAAVIAQAANNPVAAARSKGISVLLAHENDTVPGEINVIGRNVDEATSMVEKFIDQAFLAGLSHLRIVHGSGMGILRKSLRRYLAQHPQVLRVEEPPQNLGGSGVTEVELKV